MSVLKLPCQILRPRKRMAHIELPILVFSSVEEKVGGRERFHEASLQKGVEGRLVHILIEVALIQASILGADEE